MRIKNIYHTAASLALALLLTCSSLFAQLPSKCLVGYLENWSNLKMSQAHANYNVFCLAFAFDPVNKPGYNMQFTRPPGYSSDAALMTDIDLMHSQGKVVLLSVGGATGPIRLDNTTAMNTFISSVNAIFTRFGNKLDGIDLDLETTSMAFGSTWTLAAPAAGQTNMVNAVKSIMATYQTNTGKKMILTAAPEVIYLMGALSSYQLNNTNGGAFLPILDGLRNEIDLLQMQLYNAGGSSGGVVAWNGTIYYDNGSPDFALAMNESVVKGFTCLGGKGTFVGIPDTKLAFGLPATSASSTAGSGYVTPTNICNAAKYFKGEISKPAGVTYTMNASRPGLKGLMTWDINEDNASVNGQWNFASNFTCAFPAVTTPPTANFSANSTTICAGKTVTFTDASTNSPTSWSWNFGTGASPATATTQGPHTVTYSTSGTVTVSLTATNAAGSNTNTKTNYITINPTVVPAVSVSASATSICSGTSVTFTATSINGGTAPAYQWKKNGVNVGTNSATFTTAALANSDVITVVLTSNATCASPTTATSNSITMAVSGTVTPSVSVSASATTICSVTSVTFTATPTNGGTTPAYQWKKNGVNVGTNSATFTTTALANSDVITVVLTSNATCASPITTTSNSTTITVNPTVAPSVSVAVSQTTICAGTSVTFTATPTNGGTTPAYQWKKNGVNVGTNSYSFTTSVITNGDVFTVVMTSNATCASPTAANSAGIKITVNSTVTPTVAVSASQTTICPGTSVTFTAIPTNGGTTPSYQWKVNGVNAGTNSATFTSSALANNDKVTVVLTSNASCASPLIASSNAITMSVSSTVLPSVSVVASQTTTCAGTSVTFTATSTNGGTTPVYQWKVNGVSAGVNSATFTSSALANNDVVTVVLTSNAACAVPANATSNATTITVNSAPAAPSSFVTAPATVTQGQSGITYTVSSVANATNYNWTYSGTGVTINTNGNSTVTLDFSSTSTSGVLSVSASNSCGTSGVLTKSITVSNIGPPSPAPITSSQNPVIAGTNGVMYCVPNIPGTNFTWSYSGLGATINGNGSNCITIDYSSTATSGTLSLVSNDGSGSSNPRTLDVTVQTSTGVTMPSEGVIMKAYPNPFDYSSTIQIDMSSGAIVDVNVYNAYGIKVASLKHQEYLNAGTHEVLINGLSNGAYFVKVKIGEREKTIKLIKQE